MNAKIAESKHGMSVGSVLVPIPPLEKGSYCFATVGRSVCRSVDWFVGL